MNEAKAEHYREILDEVAKHSSETERRAEEAERETDKLKKAQYMENHIGEVFEGIVSGVTNWGLFVELDNSCEGMVSAASMADDFYVYDEENIRLVGERTGKEYTLGQKVTVRVLAADRITRAVDFRIVGEDEDEDEILLQEPERVEFSKARKATEDRARKVRRLRELSGELEGEAELPGNTHSDSLRERTEKGRDRNKKNQPSEGRSAQGRKVYKVHKYKKSATSKAARSAQGKGRRKKR
jgi:ribonuclease R